MELRIDRISKRFGATPVLREASFEVADREFFFLLGPSGCGKTTLLRTIAGFYEPDSGEIRFGDQAMNGVEPHRRNTGMVFQNYALWPHLTVAGNVAYGLEVRRVPAAERKARVMEALRTVRMEAYAERTPNQLSGGQQQRVALARALVVRPDVLLLDEPLSNLDARLRLEMRDEIRRIHRETRITTIYVTHDQKEALSMADRIAVLRDGLVEQVGTPRELYRHPGNRFVAEFMGEVNWLRGRVLERDGQGIRVDTAIGIVRAAADGFAPGHVVDVGFRPESLRAEEGLAAVAGGLTPRPGEGVNTLRGVLEEVLYLGEVERYALRLSDGTRVTAFLQDPAVAHSPGATLDFRLPAASVFVLPAGGGS